MNYLLDTHVLIWFITDSEELPTNLKSEISNSSNNCFVSLASHWEMSIKHSLGRLELGTSIDRIFEIIDESGKLEFHHRDPFDRLLVGQAINENFTLISKDPEMKEYPVSIIWEK